MIFGETMNPVLKEKKFLVLAITVVVVVAGLALYLSSSSSAQSISPSIQTTSSNIMIQHSSSRLPA
jgi:cell division protein FtsL